MKHIKTTKLVTLIIVCLIVIFAALIVYTLIQRNRAAGPGRGEEVSAGPGSGESGRDRSAPGAASGPAAQSPGDPAAGGQGRGAAGRNASVVRVTPVVLGTVENTVVINGDVLPRSEVSIYPNTAGKVTELRLRAGDRVVRGQTVAMVDPGRPGEVYAQSPVISTISGTVLSAPVNPGDTVSTQTALLVVGDLSGLSVETFVPERFSTNIRLGLEAAVSFEALPGEVFPAAVDEISPVLDPASRTLRIRLRFAGASGGQYDPRLRAGMFATVSLVTSSRIDVPVIPRSSVINTYGSWIVFVVNQDNAAERREIVLGLGTGDRIEVLGGLELGERVVSTGQNFLSHGEPVRVVD